MDINTMKVVSTEDATWQKKNLRNAEYFLEQIKSDRSKECHKGIIRSRRIKKSKIVQLQKQQKQILRDGLLRKILSRLPVKSLMRFKCVCKRWRSLIEDELFVDLHYSLAQRRSELVLVTPKENVAHFFQIEDGLEGGEAIHKMEIKSYGDSIFSTTCGLFCLVGQLGPSVCVYNLSTRESTGWIRTSVKREVPTTDIDICTAGPVFGFGFDPSTKVHKVICMWEISRFERSSKELIGDTIEKICEVLTVGENEWRLTEDTPPYLLRGKAISVNGSIYRLNFCLTSWKSSEQDAIVAFDVRSERFRSIPIPKFITETWDSSNCWDPHIYLHEVDGRVSIVHELSLSKVKLWVCDEEMDAEWIEHSIPLPFDLKESQRLSLCTTQGMKHMVIQRDPTQEMGLPIFFYDLKTKAYKEIKITGIPPSIKSAFSYRLHSFVGSLLPVQKKQLHHIQLPSGK